MEYGLGHPNGDDGLEDEGLNPCFNGIWSRTSAASFHTHGSD